MNLWIGEYAIIAPGQTEKPRWLKASPYPRRSQETAKADCKWVLEEFRASVYILHFRIVLNDERKTVWQRSDPPHAWRMRWQDAEEKQQ